MTAPTLPAACEPRLRPPPRGQDEWEIEQLRRALARARRRLPARRRGRAARGHRREGGRSDCVEAMIEAGSGELAISGAFHRLTDRQFAAGEIVDVDLSPASQRLPRGHGAEHLLGEPSPGGAAALRRDARCLRRCSGRRPSREHRRIGPSWRARTRCARRATSRSGRSGTSGPRRRTRAAAAPDREHGPDRGGDGLHDRPRRVHRAEHPDSSKTRSSSPRTAARPVNTFTRELQEV